MTLVTTLLVQFAVAQATPPELCYLSSFGLAVESQWRPGEEQATPSPHAIGKRLATEAVLFQGYPIKLTISGRVAKQMQPPSITVDVTVGRELRPVEFNNWSLEGGRDPAGTGTFVSEAKLEFTPAGLGATEVTAVPRGCEKYHHSSRFVRVSVRPLAGPHDEATVKISAARQAAFYEQNCVDAVPLAIAAEQLSTTVHVDALRIRARCAYVGGKLQGALTAYELLQAALEADPKWRSSAPAHREDYRTFLAELRDRITTDSKR